MPSLTTFAPDNGDGKKRASDIDVFHAGLVRGARFEGPYDLPSLKPCDLVPTGLVSFPNAMASGCADFDKTVHFFVDDFRFERLWRNPAKYLEKLKKFQGVIEPDFSTCPNFPIALKIYNLYRNRVCAYWLQSNGVNVIPNVRCEVSNAQGSLAGIPSGATIAIGANGCIKKLSDRERFVASLRVAVDHLQPRTIVAYGSDAYGVFDYPKSLGVDVIVFPGEAFGRSGGGRDEHQVR